VRGFRPVADRPTRRRAGTLRFFSCFFFRRSLSLLPLYSFLKPKSPNTNPKLLDLKTKWEEKIPFDRESAVFVCLDRVCLLWTRRWWCFGRLNVVVSLCVVSGFVVLMLWPFEYGGVLCLDWCLMCLCWCLCAVVGSVFNLCAFFCVLILIAGLLLVRIFSVVFVLCDSVSLILLCRLWFIVLGLRLGFVTRKQKNRTRLGSVVTKRVGLISILGCVRQAVSWTLSDRFWLCDKYKIK